jgi:hypothetical protein
VADAARIEQVDGAGCASATRSRWLFAIVMFAIGIVPVSEIARGQLRAAHAPVPRIPWQR